MSGGLRGTLTAAQERERPTAVRHLLCHPLARKESDPAAFVAIVRHREWLKVWFAEQTGWKLIVDPDAGFARLHKVAPEGASLRPARVRNKPPFNRRRYTLLCFTLAALDDTPGQTTLARLAELVQELSGEGAEDADSPLTRFDPDALSERRAFVDALMWLVEAGVLKPRDGDVEQYASNKMSDVLYDVGERLLSQLVAAPVPPALARDSTTMLHEAYPDTEEGARLAARHQVFRTLLDEPVVYYEDLDPRAYDWLHHSRGFVYRTLETDVGLQVERRKEGVAAVDPEGQLSDELFPDGGSTAKHAALLLAELLTARGRDAPPLGHGEIIKLVAALLDDYAERCGWSRQYRAEGGAALLAGDAMELLERFNLVRREPEGWRARPALARFAPEAPSGATGESGTLWA